MRLSGVELLRRFLSHVLPKGLMRIRHYGYLANRCCGERLPAIREELQRQEQAQTERAQTKAATKPQTWSPTDWLLRCPRCRHGSLHLQPRPVRLEGG